MSIGVINGHTKVKADATKRSKADILKIKNEEELQSRLSEKEIELFDYIEKYAAQTEFDIIECEEENENEKEDIECHAISISQPLTSASSQNSSQENKSIIQIGIKKRGLSQVNLSDISINSNSSSKDSRQTRNKKIRKICSKQLNSSTISHQSLSSDDEQDKEHFNKQKDAVVKVPNVTIMLNDIHISTALNIMQKQFPDIGGLIDPIQFELQDYDLRLKDNNIYILHANKSHWVSLNLRY
jgi:hypothetical protein